MSPIKRPQNWLCLLAFAAAFWITFRVMAADAPARSPESTHPNTNGEVDDPALQLMIARFTNDASFER